MDRSKVGKGNRKLVREHFRKNGIELPFGRKCLNNRYSFKASDGIVLFVDDIKARRETCRRLLNAVMKAAVTCPVPVNIVQTVRPNSYCQVDQYNVAIRFEDN